MLWSTPIVERFCFNCNLSLPRPPNASSTLPHILPSNAGRGRRWLRLWKLTSHVAFEGGFIRAQIQIKPASEQREIVNKHSKWQAGWRNWPHRHAVSNSDGGGDVRGEGGGRMQRWDHITSLTPSAECAHCKHHTWVAEQIMVTSGIMRHVPQHQGTTSHQIVESNC